MRPLSMMSLVPLMSKNSDNISKERVINEKHNDAVFSIDVYNQIWAKDVDRRI